MTLEHELAQTGRRLFRWRTWAPAALLIPIVLAAIDPGPGSIALRFARAWPALCLLIGAAGLLARAMTVGFVAADTSGRNTAVGQRAARLNVTGAYSLVRHPLYAANYLLWLAPALLPGLWWPPVLVTMGYRLFYDRIILAEEAFLRDRFGGEYDTWAATTPALWPFGKGWRARLIPPDLPFSIRAVARREYPSVLSFGVTMVLLQGLIHWASTGAIRLGWPWLALLGAVLLLATVLRILNHRTKALSAEGR